LSGKIYWAVTPPLVKTLGRAAWHLDIDLGEGFPSPPFVIASNHHSFLDAFLISAAYREKVRFLALVDLFGNHRWVDFSLAAYDVIPIKRGAVALGPLRHALDHLSTGGVVGVFPEGTRHPEFDPARVRGGAAWLAVKTGIPLVPMAVLGSEKVLGPDNKLHRGRIEVKVGPSLHPSGSGRAEVDLLMDRWVDWVSFALTQVG
jgi:1-acyl-sn-glycerol-3-phosphate acyltransferase